MNITKVANLDRTEEFSVEWNGETVNFTARTASLTPGFVKQIGSVVSFPQAIASTVTDWDVTWDGEKKVALTEDDLEKLPVNFLDAVLGKVMESWTGDKKKPKSSDNGSEQAAK